MTCGACAPEMFRATESGRVFGYLVAPTMNMATLLSRKLYFLGAEGVFSDYPKGNIKHRPGWCKLHRVIRAGDKLILLDETALGSKRKYVRRNHQRLTGDGISVGFVEPSYFEELNPNSDASENFST